MKNELKNIVFILVFIFSFILLVMLGHFIYTCFLNKLFVENSYKKVENFFTIDKIVLFSSCSADANINSNNSTTINNLFQYTDIALFINNSVNEFSLENTLKSVSIKDISFNTNPSLGTPKLYYKNLNDFATPNIIEDNFINSNLDFEISSDDVIDYSKPVLFNNCANPITLSYVNTNIISDYTVSNDTGSVTYDGSLLKKCNVLLNDISCNFSFTVYIENNLGEFFRCPVYISVPLQDSEHSIYDGTFSCSYDTDYVFTTY